MQSHKIELGVAHLFSLSCCGSLCSGILSSKQRPCTVCARLHLSYGQFSGPRVGSSFRARRSCRHLCRSCCARAFIWRLAVRLRPRHMHAGCASLNCV